MYRGGSSTARLLPTHCTVARALLARAVALVAADGHADLPVLSLPAVLAAPTGRLLRDSATECVCYCIRCLHTCPRTLPALLPARLAPLARALAHVARALPYGYLYCWRPSSCL